MNCPICSSTAQVINVVEWIQIQCPRCGLFNLSSQALKEVRISKEEIPLISGWIRQHENCRLRAENLANLRTLPMPTVGEKAEKVILHFARKYPKPGDGIPESEAFGLHAQAVAWSANDGELMYLIRDYLTDEKQFLRPSNRPGLSVPCEMITPKGWAYIDSLRVENVQSSRGFIAMWFDNSMDSACLAIEQAIREAGYTPHRIDRKHHNNKIDDEIIADIRRSKFVVADFTGHRGGVYFEAGFAKGLGLEVIWLCRKSDFKELHFDTRQYAHIDWEEQNLPELTVNLKNRIEATIGHGPIRDESGNRA
jgi:nucleoside 2-deoxyribosyltransferase